jgi:fructoselysine-6-P-deglycase FrlB-like protein
MNGIRMAQEMAEQPARLRQPIGRAGSLGERVRAVAPVPLNGITIVASGSSDHAAVVGQQPAHEIALRLGRFRTARKA